MLLQAISHIDPDLYQRTVRKQAELWERIIHRIGGEWERSWSQRWSIDPVVTCEDVLGDLRFGRE